MDDSKKRSRNITFVLAAGLLMIAVIVALSCFAFVLRLNEVTRSETERYLNEVSGSVADTINVKSESIYKTLYSVGGAYLQFGSQNGNSGELLARQAKLFDFDWIGVIDANGTFRGSYGDTGSAVGYDFYSKAMDGKEGIYSLKSDEHGLGVMYSVPLYEDDQIIGSVTAWNSIDRMRQLMSVETFGGEGFSQIIDRDGNFVVSAVNKNAPRNVENFFRMMEERGTRNRGVTPEEMKADLKMGRSNSMSFTLDDGIHKAMHYQPLEVGELYLLSVVPTEMAGVKFDTLILDAVRLNLLVAVLFLLLIVLIVLINRKNNRALEAIAYVDPVTGGYSCARFSLEASSAIRAAAADTYSLISIDLQKFKLINDSFGSEAGDRTLKYIYQVISRHLKPGELQCRISADHFNVLVKSMTQEDILQELRAITADINSFNDNLEQKYYLSLCVGVYRISDPELPLVSIQDRANTARKNEDVISPSPLCTCVFYSDLERLRMLREKDIENNMEKALKNKEFSVYLQPKIVLEGNVIAGAEALVRWEDPDRGLVMPDEFIPFFEKNGFIVKLDHYVFEEVCSILRSWIDSGEKPVPISVNLSRAHLFDTNFLDPYKVIREKYDVPANLLEIELTETLVFENLEILLRVIDEIHDEGFQCSLDDFGSGYSSLNMLKDVKVDTLKLDGAFFKSMDADNDRENCVIESIVALAKKLNMKSVSEGVETVLQMEYLKQINCDIVQGYVFSKPIPLKKFEKMAFGRVLTEDRLK